MITLPYIIPTAYREIRKGEVLYVEKNGTPRDAVTSIMKAVAGILPAPHTSSKYSCSFKPDVLRRFGGTVGDRMDSELTKLIKDDAPLAKLVQSLQLRYGCVEFSELMKRQYLELDSTESQFVAVVMCAVHYKTVDLVVMDMPEIIGGGYTFMIFDELETFARDTKTPMVISRSVYRGAPGEIKFTRVGDVN